MTRQGMIQWNVTLRSTLGPHIWAPVATVTGNFHSVQMVPNGPGQSIKLELQPQTARWLCDVMIYYLSWQTWKYIIGDKAQGADNKENLTFSSQSVMIFGNYLAPCTLSRPGRRSNLGWVLGKLSTTKVSNDSSQHQILQTNNPPLLTRPDRTEFYICNTDLDTAVIIAHTILTSILSQYKMRYYPITTHTFY